MKIKWLSVGVCHFLRVSAIVFTLSGCTYEGAVLEYLVDVLPEGSAIQVTDSCSSAFGAGGGAAVFEVTFPQDASVPDLAALRLERGSWTREGSLGSFAEDHDFEVGIAATVLDGRECFRSLREDADDWLFEPKPGLFYRSEDQTVVIMMPDDAPGVGAVFSQGR